MNRRRFFTALAALPAALFGAKQVPFTASRKALVPWAGSRGSVIAAARKWQTRYNQALSAEAELRLQSRIDLFWIEGDSWKMERRFSVVLPEGERHSVTINEGL